MLHRPMIALVGVRWRFGYRVFYHSYARSYPFRTPLPHLVYGGMAAHRDNHVGDDADLDQVED
jgi:hypothetical protein